ncbi:DUF58 domain-containing protein [Candidatus Dependentiae bacterium]|nr:DUF58 domain-containing protein [Candidatus Dependentiae bacterium]
MEKRLSPETAQKIRQLEIKTRRLLQGYYIGEHRAAQKGYGLEFEQLSDYQFGHDVRFIDWKSSARMNKLLVREYKDERNRSIIIAFDISASTFFGAQRSKNDVMIDTATILIMAGFYSKDMVGLVLFSDHVEKYIPPARSRQHIELLLRTLCEIKPTEKKTSVSSALDYIARLKRRDAIVFVVSDMIDEEQSHNRENARFDKALKMICAHNDCIVLRMRDQLEKELPTAGFVTAIDSETKQEVLLNLSNSGAKKCNRLLHAFNEQQSKLLKASGADTVDIENPEKIVEQLVRFFQARASR